MTAAGLRPVLAGRHRGPLEELAAKVGLDPTTVRVADAVDDRSVRALVESPQDVLVSTVGPFARFGRSAVDAAIAAGSAYLDSTGEPSFVRRVFAEAGPRAQRSGARLMTAFGFDYVPGNLAGALAITRANAQGRPAARVAVGYFVPGGFGVSSGTKASAASVLLEPGFAFDSGAIGRVRRSWTSFTVDGRHREGFAVGGSEHFALPRLDASLTEVGVFLGIAGRWTRAAAAGATTMSTLSRVSAVRGLMSSVLTRSLGTTTGEGPDEQVRAGSRTLAVAEAFDTTGDLVQRVRVEGPSPYDLTGSLLAMGAQMMLERTDIPAGAVGPADGLGLSALVDGCAHLGLREVP
jgi:short subunit dehydrogenase-like uncharacterized protein